MLAVAVAVATAVLFTPYLAAQTAAQDAWLSVILAGLITIVPAWATASLMALPNQSIIGVLPCCWASFWGHWWTGLPRSSFSAPSWRHGGRRSLPPAFCSRRLLGGHSHPLCPLHCLCRLKRLRAPDKNQRYIVPTGMLIIIFVTTLPLRRMDFPTFSLLNMAPAPWSMPASCWRAGYARFLVIMMFYRHVKKRTTKGLAGMPPLPYCYLPSLWSWAHWAPWRPLARQSASMFYPAIEVARIVTVGTFLEHMEVALMAVLIAGLFVAASFTPRPLPTASPTSSTFTAKRARSPSWLSAF